MSEEIVPLQTDIGPAADVSRAVLLQSEFSAWLLFRAVRQVGGRFEPAGTAIGDIKGCSLTKFGYPNDEAWYAIPRTRNLTYGLFEVQQSEWAAEIMQLNRHGFPDCDMRPERHFLVLFHDSSFECLADDLIISVSDEPFENIVMRLSSRIAAE